MFCVLCYDKLMGGGRGGRWRRGRSPETCCHEPRREGKRGRAAVLHGDVHVHPGAGAAIVGGGGRG